MDNMPIHKNMIFLMKELQYQQLVLVKTKLPNKMHNTPYILTHHLNNLSHLVFIIYNLKYFGNISFSILIHIYNLNIFHFMYNDK